MNAFHDLATGGGYHQLADAAARPRVRADRIRECEAILDGARTYVLEAVGSMWTPRYTGRPT